MQNKVLNFICLGGIHGSNNIKVACRGKNISLAERVGRFALGIFQFIPILGHGLAGIEWAVTRSKKVKSDPKTPNPPNKEQATNSAPNAKEVGKVRVIKLKETDPYKRGEEHGKLLASDVKRSIQGILAQIKARDKRRGQDSDFAKLSLDERCKRLEKELPDESKQEIKGIAKGAGIDYKDVLMANLVFSLAPDIYGCSAIAAAKKTDGTVKRFVITNHRDEHSVRKLKQEQSTSLRYTNLEKAEIHPNTKLSTVLAKADRYDTVQKMVFYPNTCSFDVAARVKDKFSFQSIKAKDIFENPKMSDSKEPVALARNLDWPWESVAKATIVLVRKETDGMETASILMPGFIPVLSGMNNYGVSVTLNRQHHANSIGGYPILHLLGSLLKTSQSAEEFKAALEKSKSSCSANIMLADARSVHKFEIHPTPEKREGWYRTEGFSVS